MPSPLISILIPTYEPRPEHLREALQSLKSQTLTDWAALIHDDASTADVHAIVAPFLSNPRISFERSEQRLGIGGNWNACLRRATGSYAQFLFQDDTWAPTYLQQMVKVLKADPALGFASAHHRYRADDGAPLPPIYGEVLRARQDLAAGKHPGRMFLLQWIQQGLRPNVIGEPSFVMLHRDAARQAGEFLENMPQLLDTEYWTRLLLRSDWYLLKEELGTFRVHAGSTSARNEAEACGLLDRFRCFQLLIRSLPSGAERSAAMASRDQQLTHMLAKWLERGKAGRNRNRAGEWRKLALRDYPVLIAAAARHMLKQRQVR